MPTTYTYDPNGNQTTRGGDAFTYDHENRLTKIVLPNTVAPESPCADVTGDGVVAIDDVTFVSAAYGSTEPFYDFKRQRICPDR